LLAVKRTCRYSIYAMERTMPIEQDTVWNRLVAKTSCMHIEFQGIRGTSVIPIADKEEPLNVYSLLFFRFMYNKTSEQTVASLDSFMSMIPKCTVLSFFNAEVIGESGAWLDAVLRDSHSSVHAICTSHR
jgi:hypothetical protein